MNRYTHAITILPLAVLSLLLACALVAEPAIAAPDAVQMDDKSPCRLADKSKPSDDPLKETHWQLLDIEGVPLKKSLRTASSLTFSADGQIYGRFCNGFGGFYEVKENTLTTSRMMTQLVYCSETSDLESKVYTVLREATCYEIRKDKTLTIYAKDGSSLKYTKSTKKP